MSDKTRISMWVSDDVLDIADEISGGIKIINCNRSWVLRAMLEDWVKSHGVKAKSRIKKLALGA